MNFGQVPEQAKRMYPWAKAMVIGPPPTQADKVSPVEALVDDQTEIGRAFRLYVYPTLDELNLLQAGQPIEFSIYAGQLVPVSVFINEVPK